MYLPSFLLASFTNRHIQKLNSSLVIASRTTGTVLNFSKSVSCFKFLLLAHARQTFIENELFRLVFLGILSFFCFSRSWFEKVWENLESVVLVSLLIFQNTSSLISNRLFNSWLKSMSNDMVFSVKNEQILVPSFE